MALNCPPGHGLHPPPTRISPGKQCGVGDGVGTIVGAGKGGVAAVTPGGHGTLAANASSAGGSGGLLSEAEILACLNQREIHRANKNWAQCSSYRPLGIARTN